MQTLFMQKLFHHFQWLIMMVVVKQQNYLLKYSYIFLDQCSLSEYQNRQSKLRQLMEELEIDHILFSSIHNINYASIFAEIVTTFSGLTTRP
jgi:hypothetical protein